jgi:ketosteroid isomerase-like protein
VASLVAGAASEGKRRCIGDTTVPARSGDLDEAFTEPEAETSEVRDLGEQVIAIGHLRGRGREGGAKKETAIVWLVEFKNGKAVRVREYLDPKEALEAAGLSK